MYYQQNKQSDVKISEKSWFMTLLLMVSGWAYCFYLGHWKKGLLFMFTAGGLVVGWAIDVFKLFTGKLTDSDGAFVVKK